MIDIHTHLVPGVDDGSPDLETSVKSFKSALDAGVDHLLLTPHYMKGQWDNTRAVVDRAMPALQDALKSSGLSLTLHKGAEVMLQPGCADDIERDTLNIDDTKYVLVESDLNGFPMGIENMLYEIVRKGYRPIMAHPERYLNVARRPNVCEDLMHREVLMQINAPSLLGRYGKEVMKTAWTLLENGWAHFLGSDFHGHRGEYPLAKARDLIRENIDEHTADLLTVENPSRMLAGEDVEMFYVRVNAMPKKSRWDKFFEFLRGGR